MVKNKKQAVRKQNDTTMVYFRIAPDVLAKFLSLKAQTLGTNNRVAEECFRRGLDLMTQSKEDVGKTAIPCP